MQSPFPANTIRVGGQLSTTPGPGDVTARMTPDGTPRSSALLASPVKDGGRREKIWVAIRVRPLLPSEIAGGEQPAWASSEDATCLVYTPPAGRISHSAGSSSLLQSQQLQPTPGGSNSLQFDKVFDQYWSSEQVYAVAAKDLVLSSMHGYNSTIFAYGQTGSGKTYTMGAIMTEAAKDVFGHIQACASREFMVRCSAVEIYNEEVRDLLSEGCPPIRLQDDPERGTVPEGLTEEGVTSVGHLKEMLRQAEERRQSRATRMNDNSSRSHKVVRLYIESHPAPGFLGVDTPKSSCSPGGEAAGARSIHEQDGDGDDDESLLDFAPVTISTINFVDLAGSERAAQAAFDSADKEKQRLKEASNINKSLLTLGVVIRVLGDATGKKHVPYRDSQLTRMLKHSLSGNSRMAIVCTISPSASCADNTRGALHFANAAKQVTMRPKVNEVTDEKAVMRQMQREIAMLKRKLEQSDRNAEAEQLNAALRQKEEQIRLTVEERDKLHQRIQGLEKLILRGDANSVQRRQSWDFSTPGPLNGSLKSFRQSGLRASWNPESPHKEQQQQQQQQVAGSSRQPLLVSLLGSPTLRAAEARRSASQLGTGAADAAAAAAAMAPVTANAAGQRRLMDLQSLQGATGQQAEEALAALQAEVRCIRHVHGGGPPAQPEHTIQRLKQELQQLEGDTGVTAAGGVGGGGGGSCGITDEPGRQDTMTALRAEISRLEQAQTAHYRAAKALESLQKKIGSMHSSPRSSTDLSPSQSQAAAGPAQPGGTAGGVMRSIATTMAERWRALPIPGGGGGGSSNRRTHAEESPSSSPLLASPVADARHHHHSWNSQQGGDCAPPPLPSEATPRPRRAADDTVMRTSDQMARDGHHAAPSTSSRRYKGEQHKVSDAFKESAEKNVSTLRDVMQHYKEQLERLDMQKRMLLNQVLRLEFALEEESRQKVVMAEQLTRAESERDQARLDAKEARARAAAALRSSSGAAGPGPGSSASSTPRHQPNLSIFDASEDSWAQQPSAETLLPRIVDLWEQLYVPLVYRSRFFLSFQGREVFYYEMEQRRLEWKYGQMYWSDAEGVRHRSRELEKAWRALDWERKSLAQQIKWELNEQERATLYREWQVDPLSKERKLQLVWKLWDKETLAGPEGMRRSSELVVRLSGLDAAEHMFELVFGNFEREYTATGTKPINSNVGFMVSNLLKKVVPSSSSSRKRSPSGGSRLRRDSRPEGGASFTSRLHSGLLSIISGGGGGGSEATARRSASFSSAGSLFTRDTTQM